MTLSQRVIMIVATDVVIVVVVSEELSKYCWKEGDAWADNEEEGESRTKAKMRNT